MAKHIQAVKDAIGNGQELHQDMFLHEADVCNIATKLAKETYMLDKSDAKREGIPLPRDRCSIVGGIERLEHALHDWNLGHMAMRNDAQVRSCECGIF